jgi:capsid protein
LGFFIYDETRVGYGGATEQAQYRQRSDCLWPAYRKRVSQTRGVPYLASGLGLFDRLDGYLDSETLAAELNSHNVWKMWDTDSAALPGQMSVTDPNETAYDVDSYEALLRSEPGTVHRLKPGEDFDVVGLKRPGDTFEPYVVHMLRLFGAGIGYPLELVLLDFSKTNYSSARAALQEARRHFRLWQRMLAMSIVTPWYRRRVSQAIAAGDLPYGENWDRHIVQWPGWDWIDPQKEAAAFEKLLELKVKSRTEMIRERGREPADVYDELRRDEEMLAERELVGAASDETVETGGPEETGEPDSGDEMSAGDDDGA